MSQHVDHDQRAYENWNDDGGNEPRRHGRTSLTQAGAHVSLAVSLSRQSLVTMPTVLIAYRNSSHMSNKKRRDFLIIIFSLLLIAANFLGGGTSILHASILNVTHRPNHDHSNDVLCFLENEQ